MEEKKSNTLGRGHIPLQFKGSEMNAVEEAVMDSEEKAIAFFELVKKRLLDVNRWGELAELPMSTFRLTDKEGKEIAGSAKEGLYFKIDIPGPGTKTGDGFDWVFIESIQSEKYPDQEYLSMRVRPVANPSGERTDTAHFLENDATSTFQVKRIGNTLYAEEHGRNEVPNTKTENTMDNIRNTMVGWSAKLGMSYPQWKSLVKGLLHQDK